METTTPSLTPQPSDENQTETIKPLDLTDLVDSQALRLLLLSPPSSPPPPGSNTNILALPYRAFLHKTPHKVFLLIPRGYAAACIACDSPSSRYRCSKCQLILCRRCKFVIARVAGDVRKLVSMVARWKLGFSQSFLEEEGWMPEEEKTYHWRHTEKEMDGHEDLAIEEAFKMLAQQLPEDGMEGEDVDVGELIGYDFSPFQEEWKEMPNGEEKLIGVEELGFL